MNDNTTSSIIPLSSVSNDSNSLAILNQQDSSLQLLDVEKIRKQFPTLMAHPNILFFDNASTTQRPNSVINAITHFYYNNCANAGRAAYSWSTQLSSKIEENRSAVARLINADACDVAFTYGATNSLNLVSTGWGLNNLADGDEVMLCLEDHQSAVLPWINLQKLLKHFGTTIKIVPFALHSTGTYDRSSLQEGISSRTRVIAISHVHHLCGMEMDLPELKEIIPNNVLISLDASQSIGHTKVDVKKLGVHFISFSGHKMFAANGTGVLWVHPRLRQSMYPSQVGAKSAVQISSNDLEIDRSTLAGIIECGTLNLPGLLTYIPAVQFMESLGIFNIEEYVSALTTYLYKQLKTVPGIEFAPGMGNCHCVRGYGIISFKLSNIASVDLAAYLDSEGIFVRTGDHCIATFKDHDYTRISLHVYNTLDEIDRFIEALKNAIC